LGKNRTISRDLAERIRDSWAESSSLKDAIANAGSSTTDERTMRRYRRQTEELLGIELPAHNAKFSTHKRTECESTLDISAAKEKKSFIITYCVNNCPINSKFLDSLEVLAEENDSQILIIPQAYRNPDDLAKVGFKDYRYKWPDRVKKYILNEEFKLGNMLVVSPIGIKPTVKNPLSGKDPNEGRKSAIYGHSQVSMITVPTPSKMEAKRVYTTGAISRARYPKLDTGRSAAFNHVMAALYVHMDGNNFHTLNLHWSGSGFHFLNKKVTPDGIDDAEPIKALIQGDSHAVWSDDKVLKSRDRLIDMIDPQVLGWHDLHDHKYQSHHATVTDKIRMALNNEFLVEKELQLSLDLINEKGKGRKNLIIGSNHNDHLDKWLDKFKDKEDPHNALFAKELHAAVIRSGKPAFEEWMHDKVEVDVEFVGRNDYYTISGIDVSQHGDVGGNGSRATARGFSRYSYKTIIGHSHSPRIEKGCYQMGTSSKKMSYVKGYSSWAECDCIIYPDGKRTLVFYTNGKNIGDFYE